MTLLSVDSVNTYDHGVILDAWQIGGKRLKIKPPFQPYFYSLKNEPNGEAIRKKLLSDLKWRTVWKREFHRTDTLEQNRTRWTVEDTFPFKQRIAIDAGYKFPSGYPRILAWDVETLAAGLSPNWRLDKIISIATWGDTDESHRFFHGPTLIKEFLDFLRQNNPDILADFFGRFYDVPTLIQNCNNLNIRCVLGRDGSTSYIIKKEFERRGKGKIEHTVRIGGRVHFDVQKETDADYTLTLAGLKDRGLKEVARHYGLKPVTVDYREIGTMPIEKLREYNLSDARCTYELAQIYFRGLFQLAEYLNVPVDMIVNRQPSHVGNFAIGRQYQKYEIISDGENMQRFPSFFNKPKSTEGAVVKCFQTGTFLDIVHKDFNSMYVNIMRTFNLSPETVSLLSVSPFTGRYSFTVKKDFAVIEVPDKYQGQVTCRVELQDGILREILGNIAGQRTVLKKKWKETGNLEFWSQEWALKIVGNAIYGYNIMPHSKYGNVLVGIICTAIGRYLIRKATEEEQAVGNLMLEIDTDGQYLQEKQQIEFNACNHFPPEFKTELLTMSREQYNGIILMDDKSYILKKKDGKTIRHGSGILGRHIPAVLDKFIDELAQCLFASEDPQKVMREWDKSRILSYPKEAFVSYVALSKRPEMYKQTTLYHNLVQSLKRANIYPAWGDKINFVKTVNGYKPTVLLRDTDKIDHRYYQGRMAYIASRMTKKPFRELREFFDGQIRLEEFGW